MKGLQHELHQITAACDKRRFLQIKIHSRDVSHGEIQDKAALKKMIIET